jgi:L,D-transpeptidase catalytic domain
VTVNVILPLKDPARSTRTSDCSGRPRCFDKRFAVRERLCRFRLILLAALLSGAALDLDAKMPLKAQIARLQKQSPDSAERIEMVRVQIFLDNANFRPGKIDGLGGEFTQKAADRYCRANGLPLGSRLDVASIAAPYRDYTITKEDSEWIGPQASEPAEQETLKAMLYADLWELVAERFHCDLDFLHELNRQTPKGELSVGSVVRVPNVGEFEIAKVVALEKQRKQEEKAKKDAGEQPDGPSHAATPSLSPAENGATSTTPIPPPGGEPLIRRLELFRAERLIELYEGDRLIACFPCTPGSRDVPVPDGQWKVTANVLMPYFRWDKSVLENGVRSDNAYNLPPGPNNPVGIVWMAINKPSVGMHGTPNPDQIGRNESHGCIRMSNWDAFLLSELVEKGTLLDVK